MSTAKGRTAAFVVLACLAAGSATTTAGVDTRADNRTDTSRLRTVTFESPAVGRTMAYDVLLPAGYDRSTERYPVLYLLHGIRSHHGAWKLLAGAAGDPAWPHDLIVVMPDAGNTWYVNWAGEPSTDNGRNAWEDYIVVDLIGHVDATFRTVAERAGRAVSGFSMGGFGALVLGLRNPDRFVSVGSISGYLDYARAAGRVFEQGWQAPRRRRSRPAGLAEATGRFASTSDPAIASHGFASQGARTPSGRPFDDAEAARAHDPFTLVTTIERERMPHLHLACGTADALFGFTRELAELLLSERIPFGYWQGAGRHDDAFKHRALRRLVPRQFSEMQNALESST